MLGLTKSDVIYIVTHIFMFLAAYAVSMSGLGSHDLFDWRAVSSGLMAAGATSIGNGISSGNGNNHNGNGISPKQ
jgi:hypothetical protein